MIERVTSQYEHALQAAYYSIGNRGICVNTDRIAEAKAIVRAEVARQLAIASHQWGLKVFVGAANAPDKKDTAASININATQGKYALLNGLKNLGYGLEKITKKDLEGNYEQTYSTGELALQRMLAKNQFNYPGGDPALKAVLKIRELGKLYSSYLNARLYNQYGLALFLSNYNVAGTLSGRRSSRRHTFGYGNNSQNFPKHSDVAEMFRRCLVARPGNILLMVDQISAEDWPVSALAENHAALAELRSGTVDRHTKLAAAIFNIPIDSRTPQQWKDSMERYLGKKTRHASNYDMKAGRMSDALAQEGFSFTEAQCKVLLDKMAAIDPNIKAVFHKYVQDTINRTHMLVSPTGRERQFLGARPNDHNSTVFKEAFSWIPQGIVGDNTGFTVLRLESELAVQERRIIQEGHDSIIQDIPRSPDTIIRYLTQTDSCFRRTFKFHNGIEITIPIEGELGYDFATTVKIKTFTLEGVKEALEKLDEKLVKQNAATQNAQVLISV
jgi:DNA polymerase family A